MLYLCNHQLINIYDRSIFYIFILINIIQYWVFSISPIRVFPSSSLRILFSVSTTIISITITMRISILIIIPLIIVSLRLIAVISIHSFLIFRHSLTKFSVFLQWKHPSFSLSCLLHGYISYTRILLPRFHIDPSIGVLQRHFKTYRILWKRKNRAHFYSFWHWAHWFVQIIRRVI